MGASDWLLVLPTTRDWTTYYFPKLTLLDENWANIWYYKLPYFPYSGEGNPEEHPGMNERIYLAYNKVIVGWCRTGGAVVNEEEGYPVIGDEDQSPKGAGVYVLLAGPYHDIAFIATDGTPIPSAIENIPKKMYGLRRLVF